MAAIINADDGVISGASGLKLSSDTSGALNIQTNGVTAIAISASQAVSFPATTSLNFTSANITTLTSSSATITNLLATTLTVSSVGIFPAGSASSAAITTAGDTNTGIFFPAADTIAFAEGGVESMRIDSSGNLGLGVTPGTYDSAYKVLNFGPTNNYAIFYGSSNSDGGSNSFGQIGLGNNFYDSPSSKYVGTGAASVYLQSGGRHRWYNAGSGSAGGSISFTERMTLDASGNLGIGTSSPGSRLEVSGVGTFTAGTQETWGSSGLTFGASRLMRQMESTSTAREYICGPDASTYGTYEFYTARSNGSPTLAYAVSAAGNVGIGTSSPGYKLDVNTTGGSAATARLNGNDQANVRLRLENGGSSGRTWEIVGGLPGANNSNFSIYDVTAATTRATITAAGDMGLGTTSPTTFSLSGRHFEVDGSNGSYSFIHNRTANVRSFYAVNESSGLAALYTFTNHPLVFGTNNTERARITAAGNLGIGTTSPAYSLQVQKTATATPAFMIGGGFYGGPRLQVYGLDDNGTAWMGMGTDMSAGIYELSIYYPNASGNGRISFGTYNGTTYTERMSLSQAGNLNVVGALSKGSGSFRIPHPLKEETHDLVHSFIEGPQADLIYSGKVQLEDGVATVNIDAASGMTEGTFVVLCRDIRCFTNNETDWDNVRGKVIGNLLTIECQNPDSDAVISWMVIGERQDKHMYDTDWTDKNGKVIVEPLKPVKKTSYN